MWRWSVAGGYAHLWDRAGRDRSNRSTLDRKIRPLFGRVSPILTGKFMSSLFNIHAPQWRKKSCSRLLSTIGVTGALLAGMQGAHAEEAERNAADAAAADSGAGEIIVTGNSQYDKIKAEAAKVPGSVSVVLNAEVERGRASNAEDVLAFVPGVYAQATSGNSANKISIRGSGLNTFYQGYSLGMRYFYDGLPITGPGGTQEDLLNIAAVNYTQILNGSNAFSFGALSLGGGINFVTHTGETSPGIFASAEVGSFGHRKFQASGGGVSGNTDAYVSVGYNKRTGFQRDTENDGYDFIANFGHSFSDKLKARFILRHRKEDLLNGSTLTLNEIRTDPRQNRLVSGRKKKGTTLLIGKLSYEFDDESQVEFGVAYNNFPLYNGWKTVAPQVWDTQDFSLSLRYSRTDTLFGMQSETNLAIIDTNQIYGDVTGYDVVDGARTFRQYAKFTGSRDSVAALTNTLDLTPQLKLSTGLSFINIRRNVRILRTVRENTSSFPSAVKSSDFLIVPRIGMLFDASRTVQVFGNVTKSADPPVTWQLGSTGNPYIRPLEPQKATTAELGARVRMGDLEGSLTAYRSWVDKELLTIIIVPATPTSEALTANANATPTIHQGIEAALQWKLFETKSGHSLSLRQSYTYNDFYYRNDPRFGSNKLPGLPDHVYQGELAWEHRSGFYAGVNVRALSGYYVDYANTLRAPRVAIWGARLGYEEPGKQWKAYVDFRNIGDKRYAAASNTAYDLKGVDSPNFYVGDGFAVYSGVSFRL